MPLYEYRCRSGHMIEALRRIRRRRDPVVCGCGQSASIVISMPARTPYKWGDTPWTGYRDRGLGVRIEGKRHRESLMKARGLRELAPGEAEVEQSRAIREHEAHERNIQTYQRVYEDTGSDVLAMKETFPDPEV